MWNHSYTLWWICSVTSPPEIDWTSSNRTCPLDNPSRNLRLLGASELTFLLSLIHTPSCVGFAPSQAHHPHLYFLSLSLHLCYASSWAFMTIILQQLRLPLWLLLFPQIETPAPTLIAWAEDKSQGNLRPSLLTVPIWLPLPPLPRLLNFKLSVHIYFPFFNLICFSYLIPLLVFNFV